MAGQQTGVNNQGQVDPSMAQSTQGVPMFDPTTGQPIQQQGAPMFDPYTGQPLSQNQQQVQAGYGGSPEAGPVRTESAPSSSEQSVEYGDKAIERIEQQQEKAIENSNERQRPQQPPQQKPQTKKKSKPKAVNGPKPPSFFGYSVPPSALNPARITKEYGKGNTTDTQTWVAMFLHRLIDKQKHSN